MRILNFRMKTPAINYRNSFIFILIFLNIIINAQDISDCTFEHKNKVGYLPRYLVSGEDKTYFLETYKHDPVALFATPQYFIVSFNHKAKSFERSDKIKFNEKCLQSSPILSKIALNTLHILYSAKLKDDSGYGLVVDFFDENEANIKSMQILTTSNTLDLKNIDYSYSSNKKFLGVNSTHSISVYNSQYEKIFSKKTDFFDISGSYMLNTGEIIVIGIKNGNVYLDKFNENNSKSVELDALGSSYVPYDYILDIDSVSNKIKVSFLVGEFNEKKKSSAAHHITLFEVDLADLSISNKVEIDFNKEVMDEMANKKELIPYLKLKDIQFYNKKTYLLLQKEYNIISSAGNFVHVEGIVFLSTAQDGTYKQILIDRRPTRSYRKLNEYMSDPFLVCNQGNVYLFYNDVRNFSGKIKYNLHCDSFDASLNKKQSKSYPEISSENYEIDFSNMMKQSENRYLLFGNQKFQKLGFGYLTF